MFGNMSQREIDDLLAKLKTIKVPPPASPRELKLSKLELVKHSLGTDALVAFCDCKPWAWDSKIIRDEPHTLDCEWFVHVLHQSVYAHCGPWWLIFHVMYVQRDHETAKKYMADRIDV